MTTHKPEDALSTPIENYARILMERGRLREENEHLRQLNKELFECVSIAANAYHLQALRDRADPETYEGWVKLNESARALLQKVRDSNYAHYSKQPLAGDALVLIVCLLALPFIF